MQAILRMFGAGKKEAEAPAPMAMPAAPSTDTAQQQAEKAAAEKRRAVARSRTIFTSPLGITGQANVIRKTLLGQ